MGYTHYWEAEKVTAKLWKQTGEAMNRLFASVDTLCREYDEPSTAPVANFGLIAFNGKGEAGHETFYVERNATGFQCCKTAAKPYDTAVCAALIYFASVHGWKVSSDGDAGDWQGGLDLAHRVWPELSDKLLIPHFVISPED